MKGSYQMKNRKTYLLEFSETDEKKWFDKTTQIRGVQYTRLDDTTDFYNLKIHNPKCACFPVGGW